MKSQITTRALALCLLGALASGCSLIVDGVLDDREDGGTEAPDAGGAADCAGMPDGTTCGAGRVCISEACASSVCGDGVVDPTLGEECDDGNDEPGDGCESNCDFTCESDADCDDGLPCNGEETCGADHTCFPGAPLSSGDDCEQPTGGPGVCRNALCVPPGCGNGIVDEGEECDDGNSIDGDGCESDCTYTCESDEECDDGSVCTGTETCDTDRHVCLPGTPLECRDESPCTRDECDPIEGCVFPLIDNDGDGHASQDLGPCGTDCNDMRADVNPDAIELCGDALDSDCDGEINPPTTPFWYLDCDGDGYAALNAASRQSCSEPPPSTCGGGWTTRVPVAGEPSTFDCNDANANVFPGQWRFFSTPIPGAPPDRDYDYDCDGVEEPSLRNANVSTGAVCEGFRGRVCRGASGWVDSTVPACGEAALASVCSYNERADACTRSRGTPAQECR